ncbi:MAG TPA: type 4a pilus biogenesis protein PilO [Kofleriaceae bacterium]
MAASGVMADFARMPTQRKVMVFVIIGALLGLLYFRFVLSSLKTDVEEAEAAYATNVTTNRKLTDDKKAYDELIPRMEVLNATINENKKALPTEAEVPAFFDTLVVKAKESGVEVKVTPKPTEPIESFVKIPAELELTGTFMQIKRFFASLVDKRAVENIAATPDGRPEERERIVSIENLVLSQPAVRAGQIILNARFTAVTFRQQDADPAAAPAPGAAAPARPATPTPSKPAGTAPPPLPSPGSAPAPTNPIGKARAAAETANQVMEERTKAGNEPAGSGGAK